MNVSIPMLCTVIHILYSVDFNAMNTIIIFKYVFMTFKMPKKYENKSPNACTQIIIEN